MTQRSEPLLCDSWTWTSFFLNLFSIWLKELNSFQYDSKNWTFVSNVTQRFWSYFLKYDSKNWTFLFFLNITQRIELVSGMTQWIELVLIIDSKKSSSSKKVFDSKNWTLLFHMTHRIEPFFSTWLKEWNFFFSNMTRRIVPSFVKHDSENCTFFF